MREHGLDPTPYLEHVHDIDLTAVAPAPRALRRPRPAARPQGRLHQRLARARAPGDAGDRPRGLLRRALRLRGRRLRAEARGGGLRDGLRARRARSRRRAAMFEDDHRNLEVPHRLGMRTVLVGPGRAAIRTSTTGPTTSSPSSGSSRDRARRGRRARRRRRRRRPDRRRRLRERGVPHALRRSGAAGDLGRVGGRRPALDRLPDAGAGAARPRRPQGAAGAAPRRRSGSCASSTPAGPRAAPARPRTSSPRTPGPRSSAGTCRTGCCAARWWRGSPSCRRPSSAPACASSGSRRAPRGAIVALSGGASVRAVPNESRDAHTDPTALCRLATGLLTADCRLLICSTYTPEMIMRARIALMSAALIAAGSIATGQAGVPAARTCAVGWRSPSG